MMSKETALDRARALVTGWREAAIIEQAIVDFCEPIRAEFDALDETTRNTPRYHEIIRRMRNGLDARDNAKRFTADADALDTLIGLVS
jgi:hypothetical protein